MYVGSNSETQTVEQAQHEVCILILKIIVLIDRLSAILLYNILSL